MIGKVVKTSNETLLAPELVAVWHTIETAAEELEKTWTGEARPGGFTRPILINGEVFVARITFTQNDNKPMAVAVLVQPHVQMNCSWLRENFGLTPREAEVAMLLAQRLSNKEIARRLSFTKFTAERHTERVLAKLGINSRRHVRKTISGRV